MNLRSVRVLLVLCCVVQVVAAADTLALRGGDRLAGKAIEIAEGTLVFRTAFAGLLVTPVDEVEWLTTDSYFVVSFVSAAKVTGRFVARDGTTRLVSADSQADHPVDLSTVDLATPVELHPKAPLDDASDGPSFPLDGDVGLGVLRRWGDSDRTTSYANLSLSRESDQYRFVGRALLELSNEDTFPGLFDALAEWQFRPGETVEPEIVLGLERDPDRSLALRADIGAGAGRTLLDNDRMELRLSGGLAAEFAYYDADLRPGHPDYGLPGRLRDLQAHLLVRDLFDEGPEALEERFRRLTSFKYYDEDARRRMRQDLNLYFRLRHSHHLFGSATLAEELSIYPGLTDPGRLRARSQSSLQFPLTSNLSLRLELLVHYDDEPAFRDIDQWSTSVGAGIEWGF